MKTASWVIKRKDDDKIMCETFSENVIRRLNTELYYAVPIMEHLQSLNRSNTERTDG